VPDRLDSPADLARITLNDVDAPIIEPAPQISPAGPWTQALWSASAPLHHQIARLPFITDLGRGTLNRDDFSFYLAQDAVYLSRYSPALASLAASAPNTSSALFWVKGAAECLEEEASLHRSWLGESEAADPSHVTASYTSHLLGCVQSRDHVVGAAAVLPCYWLYAEIGLNLAAQSSANNPYSAWLDNYSSTDFTDSVSIAIGLVEQAFQDASPQQRAEAARAYLDASRWELEFFDQASRRR